MGELGHNTEEAGPDNRDRASLRERLHEEGQEDNNKPEQERKLVGELQAEDKI